MPRLFVALNLPDPLKDELDRLLEYLKKRTPGGELRWAKRDQFHVTLKFIGEVEDAWVPPIRSALTDVTKSTSKIALHSGSVGTFGRGDRLHTVWIGLEGEKERLSDLVGRIEEALEPIGIRKEGRGFEPHITLARVRREAPPAASQHLKRVLADAKPIREHRFAADHISLMKSTLRPDGSIYEELAVFPFTA
ncbi:MAG: RNA 2',3'-cyclic phosphodiesterase [Pseudomonadota bacterium]